MCSYSHDVGMDHILETVLDDIDHMMSLNASGSTYSANTPIYDAIGPSSSHSHSSKASSFGAMCNIDEFLKTESPLNITNTPSSISTSNSYDAMSNIDLNSNVINAFIQTFRPQNAFKLQLKDHIFISKDCTYRLSQYLVKEAWGKQCSLLYKYLDYIFRCQAFNQRVIEIHHRSNKKVQFLLFHTGLQRRSDNRFIYALMVPNSVSKIQRWRVQYGNIRNSFLSHHELMQKLKQHQITLNTSDLPQRTKFFTSLSELLYDDTCCITSNWEERIQTNQDRIYKVMRNIAFFDDDNKILKLTELMDAFVCALPKTQRIAQLNPRLVVPQGFVDTKHGKYRMELLLPIIIKFPKYNGNYYKFALAIGKQHEKYKQYVVKSILTMEMAYANARLVGYVDSVWLCNGNNKKDNTDINDFCVNI